MTAPTAERVGQPAAAQGVRSGACFLAGIRGHGTMQVLRGRRDDVVEITGTWRPEEEGRDLADLQRAVDHDEPVRFEGTLHDPATPERTEVVAKVVVRSFGDYTFDAGPEDGGTGPTLRVFNLSPVDDREVLGAA